MSTEVSRDQIVRWEVLNGLPGDGQVPKHCHLGHPTPWMECFVVRFWNADGSEWVGNFQRGSFGQNEITAWPEANAVVVVAGGNFYLVNVVDPTRFASLGPQSVVSCAILNEDYSKLFVAEENNIIACGRDLRPIWQSRRLDGVVISMQRTGGALAVEIERELGEPLVTVRLSADDGSCLL